MRRKRETVAIFSLNFLVLLLLLLFFYTRTVRFVPAFRARRTSLTRRGGWFCCDLDASRGGESRPCIVNRLPLTTPLVSRCCCAVESREAERRQRGVREGEGAGWGAVCVSSALKRNKGTHGGSSRAGFSVSLREFYLTTAPTVSLTCNSC